MLQIGAVAVAPEASAAASPALIRQSARAIPVVDEVDVLVAGGGTGAVAAASQAARSGAKVFLIAPHPYLGEDCCATLQLWLEANEQPTSPLAKQLFAESPARPMHVKRTLDQALLDAGVRFLFGCYATDVLHDDRGRIAGVVMANRAGRQAIQAKVVIDATERATVARLSGAKFAAYPSGPAEFRRVVVGGPAPRDLASVRRLDFDWFGKDEPNAAFECKLSIPMADGSFASFARAEQQARNRTFHPQQLDASEQLFQSPPDAMEGQASAKGDWPGAERVDLDVFRPNGVARVYVLGGCAAVSREAATEMLRPHVLIEVGARIGQAAAEEAAAVSRTDGVRVAGSRVERAQAVEDFGEIREPLHGIRPTQHGLPTAPSPESGVPVLGRYDVVVIGGGTSGAAAGIGAARQGVRTLVVEYQHSLGGVGTLGLIGNYWHGVRAGFTSEVDQGVAGLGAKVKVLGKAQWWRRELLRAGAEVWFGALGCGAVVDRGRVCGVVVATPQGRGVVLATVVIDATGNADIAAAAGARCAYVDESDISMQLAGLPARRLGDSYVNTCYMYTDETDIVDTSHLLVYAKDRFRDAYDLGAFVDTRERRRIVGDFVLTPVDLHAGRTYPDTISVHASNYDMYGFPVHPLYLLAAPPKAVVVRCRVPYRCLLPKDLEGLLVVGIAVSADRDAMPIIRMQPDMQNLGYAAGVAAAMAVRAEQPLRAIAIKTLQNHLIEIGNLPAEVLEQTDSLPVSPEKLRAAVEGDVEDLGNLAILLAHPAAALPLVRERYRLARSEEARLNHARLLAILGDKSGLPTLLSALERCEWDAGQDIVTSGQQGANYSRVDLLILALGRTGDPQAVGPICAKAKQLAPGSGLSHFRAAAVALETIGDRSAAPTLAGLLRQPGMTGHAIRSLSEARRKRGQEEQGQGRTVRLVNPAVRELVLARALYRCGDDQGLGEQILREYEQDLQGPLARHAHAVLHPEARTNRAPTAPAAANASRPRIIGLVPRPVCLFRAKDLAMESPLVP
jgi:flavin-dependent dehydrogenase